MSTLPIFPHFTLPFAIPLAMIDSGTGFMSPSLTLTLPDRNHSKCIIPDLDMALMWLTAISHIEERKKENTPPRDKG